MDLLKQIPHRFDIAVFVGDIGFFHIHPIPHDTREFFPCIGVLHYFATTGCVVFFDGDFLSDIFFGNAELFFQDRFRLDDFFPHPTVLAERGDVPGTDASTAAKNLVKALGNGVRKTMSKMGVSTVASYTGAQIFFVLPYALVAVSVMTTFQPELASAALADNWERFRARFTGGVRLMALVIIPASVPLDVGQGAGLTLEAWIKPNAWGTNTDGTPLESARETARLALAGLLTGLAQATDLADEGAAGIRAAAADEAAADAVDTDGAVEVAAEETAETAADEATDAAADDAAAEEPKA